MLAAELTQPPIGAGELVKPAAARLDVRAVVGTIRMQLAYRQSPGAFKRLHAATGLQAKEGIVGEVVVGRHALNKCDGLLIMPGSPYHPSVRGSAKAFTEPLG